MILHVLRATAVTAVIVLSTFLPLLPGRYDPAAMTLSLMAQMIGVLGLLLVPVGALWLASEYRGTPARRRYGFAVAALVTAAVVWFLAALLAMIESLTLGLVALTLGVTVLLPLLRSARLLKNATPGVRSALPVVLIIVPIAVVLLQFTIAGPMTALTRTRAIRNSASLIADIEAHRTANGRYPPSVVSVWPDYKPSIIGIKEYRYEPSGDSYNLFFEQPSLRLGTREFVMYNPRDEQAIASHAMDVIQMTAEQLALDRRRGYNEVHDAPHPHWKYFWFD